MTCERHIQISAKTLQKQSQKQALLKDNLIRQESSEFVWQHHNKNGLQKFNSICTQWRNERAPRKSKHVSTGATAAFPVSQYRQANRIYTINSCIIFYVCVFIMDLEHVSYVWESPFTVFWQTGRTFYNGKWGFRPLPARNLGYPGLIVRFSNFTDSTCMFVCIIKVMSSGLITPINATGHFICKEDGCW